MHEMSIAMEVAAIAERTVGPARVGQVTAVALAVGEDSSLELSNLEFCLEVLLAQPPFTGARPIITRCPGDDMRLEYLEIDDDRPSD